MRPCFQPPACGSRQAAVVRAARQSEIDRAIGDCVTVALRQGSQDAQACSSVTWLGALCSGGSHGQVPRQLIDQSGVPVQPSMHALFQADLASRQQAPSSQRIARVRAPARVASVGSVSSAGMRPSFVAVRLALLDAFPAVGCALFPALGSGPSVLLLILFILRVNLLPPVGLSSHSRCRPREASTSFA